MVLGLKEAQGFEPLAQYSMVINQYKILERGVVVKCKKCGSQITVTDDVTYWDEKGFGYSTKLINCPICNCPNVIEYIEDKHLNLNIDAWYYKY